MDNCDISNDEVYANDLTWREHDILILLSQRLTNREIAGRLHLAESTVKDYVGKILSKLYVNNRREAVGRAKALGLLDPDRKTVDKPVTNLPAEPTPFIGRKDELLEIKRRFTDTRLLTLTGPGGIGKTRLALKVARDAEDDFADGCFFVALAPIRMVEHIVQTIAEAVRFSVATHEDPQYQLLRYLRKKNLLLVMDNFEHMVDGVGIVNEILQAAPEVKIIATSRERLNLQRETIFNLDGLSFPTDMDSKDILNYDAITLFVQSARKVRPEFTPSLEELRHITTICQMVQGMPLAIELAAAWLHILNVDEVVEELERGLDILATEMRDAPERHRSISAVFDHSWSLLDPIEQKIVKFLSVFRGGFTRDAVKQVSGASLQELAGLINKSFLSHDPGSGRLEIHELLRQYAQAQLKETPRDNAAAQEAHAAYYAEFMHQRGRHLRDKRQQQVLADIEADIENVRAAWQYYLDQRNTQQMWKLITGIWHVYWIRWWNHAGMELFAEAVQGLRGAQDEEILPLRALAMAFQAYFMTWLGLADRGFELAKESVEILQMQGHPEPLVFAYDSLLVNAYFLGRMDEEIEVANRMFEITTELDDKWLLAFTLFAVGMVALIEDDYLEAKRLAQLNLKLYEEVGDVSGSTMPLIILGHVALARGEYEEAKEYYLRCLELSEKINFHYSIQTASKYLSKVAISLGKNEEAEIYLHQCLMLTKEIGFVRDIVNLMYEYARLRVAQGNLAQAVELLAWVLQHPASHQTRWLEGRIRDSAKDLLSELENELRQEIYIAALERGRELQVDEIVMQLVESKR
jgi:predicted ATPase/DNA-binding CsgD family transcriptional regulator